MDAGWDAAPHLTPPPPPSWATVHRAGPVYPEPRLGLQPHQHDTREELKYLSHLHASPFTLSPTYLYSCIPSGSLLRTDTVPES